MHSRYPDFQFPPDRDDVESASVDKLARYFEVLGNEYSEAVKYALGNHDDYEDKFERFQIYSKLLSKHIREMNLSGNKEAEIIVPLLSGSILEAMLQFFLLAYEADYKKSHWHQWIAEPGGTPVDFPAIKDAMCKTVEQLQNGGKINVEQGRDLKKSVKDELKRREKGVDISRVMLDDLISLFEHEKIFDVTIHHENDPPPSEEFLTSWSSLLGIPVDEMDLSSEPTVIDDGHEIIEQMKAIRDGRNNIHIFSKNCIPPYKEVVDNIKLLCYVLEDLTFRVDCLSKFDPLEVFETQ